MAVTKKAKWPAAKIEMRKLDSLKPDPRNARLHSAEQIEQVAKSMERFGWTIPILIDGRSNILAGHARQLAGQMNGYDEAPCMVARGWSKEQRRAYILADNKLALNASWDEDLLGEELQALLEDGDDLFDFTGFSEAELGQLLSDDDDFDPNSEWEGMPEFSQEDKTAFRSMALHFKDQKAVDDFAELIGQKITESTRFVWYPEIEIETYADKVYTTEEAA